MTEQAIREFRHKRILIVGDVMLDRYVTGTIERISPEAPVPVVTVTEQSDRLGGAANVAANVTALGAKAVLYGVVGSDPEGRQLAAMVRDAGIGGKVASDEYRRTTVKTRIVAHDRQVCRVDAEDRKPVTEGLAKRIVDNCLRGVDACDAVIISDYAKGVACGAVLAPILKTARSQGKPVCIDPKSMALGEYRTASCITPNVVEAESSVPYAITDQRCAERAAGEILKASGAESVLLTRGESGMELYTAEIGWHIPACAREVYDVTGAGDTVIAVLTLGLSAGLPILSAAQLANLAAGISVGKFGAAQVTAQELTGLVIEKEAAA
jgi:D-beta-D-heptose 7-phosphate kinase/D-beta-D-heptose 1-phosphate adenosyltransferase